MRARIYIYACVSDRPPGAYVRSSIVTHPARNNIKTPSAMHAYKKGKKEASK